MELKETTQTAKEGGDSDKSEVIEKPSTVAFADEDPKTAMWTSTSIFWRVWMQAVLVLLWKGNSYWYDAVIEFS